MSKSLGNVIDPLDMIKKYGCDALRFTLAVNSGYNRNINLDPEIIEGYRNFVNKVWNAFRFMHPYLEGANHQAFEVQDLHHHEKWILCELNNVVKSVNESFNEYRFDDACNTIYSFVYDKFCSWFIELSKGILNSDNDKLRSQRANILKHCFREIMKLLHPITPFITEELWGHLKTADEDLLIAQEYPEYDKRFDFMGDVDQMEKFIELVTGIRNLRQSVNIKPKDEVAINLYTDDDKLALYFYKSRGFLKDLAKVKAGKIKDKSIERPKKSVMQATSHTEIFLPLEGVIDLSEQVNKIKKDIEKTQKEFEKVEKKLKNPKFIENAPDDVVAEVKEKALNFEEKIKSLENRLESFQ
jgi:valyl-tRNA synthetase